ncbi:hypothetical protein [Leptospira barantonii]|uniref:hypothetical protein n=1 Tax=Leptospira barantonii TaxID=2023184 RepID=UPI0014385C6A|nr:hypothetical protein [Leptospira barantonii]
MPVSRHLEEIAKTFDLNVFFLKSSKIKSTILFRVTLGKISLVPPIWGEWWFLALP